LLYVKNVTPDKYHSGQFTQLHLTSETLTWDPQTTSYAEQELAMTDHTSQIKHEAANRGPSLVVSEFHSYANDPVDVFHDCNFHQVLTSHVVVSSADTTLNGHIVSRMTTPIDSLTLAARWMISLARAKQTALRTTQRGVRICVNPTLSRRFLTNDRMLHYK
jgi:hypothetical protein